jgi:hypothetical protein
MAQTFRSTAQSHTLLELLQPVRHAHLAVHRGRGRQVLLGLLATTRPLIAAVSWAVAACCSQERPSARRPESAQTYPKSAKAIGVWLATTTQSLDRHGTGVAAR